MNNDEAFLRTLYKNLGNMFGKSSDKATSKEEEVIEKSAGVVLKEFKTEERLCTEIVYTPDVKDLHGEWMSAETIKSGEESFRRNLAAGVVKANLFHVTNTDKFEIKRSWVLQEDAKFEGRDEVVKAGTWLAETHYPDDALWEMKKSRKLGGLSLGGYGETNTETGEITNLCFSKDEFKEILQKKNQK